MESELKPEGLYIMLFARDNPNEYHWALYYHEQPGEGKMWHIRNISDTWMTGHQTLAAPMKEFLLIGLLRVASVDFDRAMELETLVTSVPHNTEGITCRIWVLNAARRLVDAGLIQCGNVDDLESEAKAFGKSEYEATCENKQPRAIAASKLCDL